MLIPTSDDNKSKMENGNKMENVMEALFAMVWRYFITF